MFCIKTSSHIITLSSRDESSICSLAVHQICNHWAHCCCNRVSWRRTATCHSAEWPEACPAHWLRRHPHVLDLVITCSAAAVFHARGGAYVRRHVQSEQRATAAVHTGCRWCTWNQSATWIGGLWLADGVSFPVLCNVGSVIVSLFLWMVVDSVDQNVILLEYYDNYLFSKKHFW